MEGATGVEVDIRQMRGSGAALEAGLVMVCTPATAGEWQEPPLAARLPAGCRL